MPAIRESIEVARSPEEAFAYITDPTRMAEWQEGVVSGSLDTASTRVGSRCTTVRKIGGGERQVTTEITEYDPPRRWADRGIDGPIRATVVVEVRPLPGVAGARVTIDLDFTGHGIGRLLVPLVVRRQAAAQMPGNMRRLKRRLEADAPLG
ncbi:MAG: SRPBCC family protein [Acidobacteriota bacterium]|nr:SRPBCC family protein [Acidobacteriota bacterium]